MITLNEAPELNARRRSNGPIKAKAMILHRPQVLAKNIVVIDGMSGGGRGLVTPILSTFERGELWDMRYQYDALCILHGMKKLSSDAACAMLRLNADLDLYHLMIARYVNFRKSDVSGTAMNLMTEKYRQRLGLPDGNSVVERVQKENPILFLMTHYITGVSQILFDAFADRLKRYIITIRHPLWLVDDWFQEKWQNRIGTDPRFFNLTFKSGKSVAPWYTAGWDKEYMNAGPMDQAIRVMASQIKQFDEEYKKISKENQQKVCLIPFERFILDPWQYLNPIMAVLKTRKTAATDKILIKLKLPRKLSFDFLSAQRAKIEACMKQENVSEGNQRLLAKLCKDYEKKHLQYLFRPVEVSR